MWTFPSSLSVLVQNFLYSRHPPESNGLSFSHCKKLIECQFWKSFCLDCHFSFQFPGVEFWLEITPNLVKSFFNFQLSQIFSNRELIHCRKTVGITIMDF